MNAARTFATFFALQFLSYAVVTWGFRSIVTVDYAGIAVADTACGVLSFTVLKRIKDADVSSWPAMAGYVAGGTVGTLLSTWLNVRFSR